MKIKKEYYILFAIILILALYLLFRDRDKTHYQIPKVPTITKKDITKIEISKKPDTSIVLNKKDERWHIAPQGYPADDNKVKPMLDVIENLTLTAMVSESKNYERYDLNDDKKIIIKAWAGEALKRKLEVGKAASSYRHTFVKLTGDHRVYHARENFRGKFDQNVDNLRDKMVLAFDKAQIQEIHITKGEKSIVFGRQQVPVEVSADEKSEPESQQPPKTETVWKSADGKEGDDSKLSRLIGTLSNLRCDNYIDGSKKEDYKEPIYSLQLKGEKDYTLSIFPKTDKDAKNHPAISSENDYPFLLPDHRIKSIMQNPDDLLKKPKPEKPEKPKSQEEGKAE
jgi:hypothetical protein